MVSFLISPHDFLLLGFYIHTEAFADVSFSYTGTDNAKAAALNMYTKFFPFLIDHSRAFNFKDLCMNTRPLLGNIEIDTSNNHSIIIGGSMIFYTKEVELMCL